MATEEKKVSLPARKVENTLGWWETGGNFFLADNEKQGRLNAQVGTWHMAGIPEEKKLEISEPEKGKRFDLDRERNLNFPEKEVLQEATPPTNNSWWENISWAKKKQQAQQTQQATEPEWFRENGVRYKDATDRNTKTDWAEFGWLKSALPKEEVKVEEKVEEKTEEPKWQDVNVNTFLQGSTTELFGKMITWADTAPYDHNSTEWLQAEARLKQYERVNALSVDQLASNIKSWSILAGWQAMRDLQAYNPEKYQMLQEYQKKQEALDQINMIASGNFTDANTNLQDQTGNSINNYLNETVANAGLDANARMDLDTALSQNQWIINYAEKMSYYQAQINQLDQTIGNLAEDARRQLSKSMGENVPEYMIQNYINNRSKKLYKQRDNLMNQYNYYKGVYEAQVEQEATAWERDYKERQLKLQESKALRDQKMDEANLNYKNEQLNYNYYQANSKNPVSSTQLQGWMNTYIESIQEKIQNNGKIREWWCGEPVNDYLKSIGVNYKYDDKKSTKLNSRNSWTPTIWSIAIWDKTGTTDWDKYWHVAIVTDINNKNGTITVLESNKNTWLRYHTYKQGNVYGYYDPSVWSKSNTTTKSTSNKNEKTYTNDELFTRLLGGKIKWDSGTDAFLKNWNGDETQDEIEDRVAKTYFEKKPMMTLSDMWDSVKTLNNMIWDEEMAELYTLDHLNQNKNISNDKIVKIVSDYYSDTYDNVDIAEYLSLVLSGRVKSQDEIKKLLDNSWIDFKKLYGEKNKKISKSIWEKMSGE